MSVKLLRKSSDLPSITNRDDASMIRYAYGGSDGVVKNFGSELSYSTLTSRFIINSGKVVVQGWEVNVGSWELNLSTVTGTQYHLVYLEVNIASEIASIKSTYLTDSVPSIDPGDDLTQYPNGTARIPLYSFKISSKTISSVEKKFSVLEYESTNLSQINTSITSLESRMGTAEDNIDSLEERLSKLGFREGAVVLVDGSTASFNYLKRQGNYVIGNIMCKRNSGFPARGDGTSYYLIGSIPEEFLPKLNERTIALVTGKTTGGIEYEAGGGTSVKTTGEIFVYSGADKVTGVEVYFGYEAAPLT